MLLLLYKYNSSEYTEIMHLGYTPVISLTIIFFPSKRLKVRGAVKCFPYFKYKPD